MKQWQGKMQKQFTQGFMFLFSPYGGGSLDYAQVAVKEIFNPVMDFVSQCPPDHPYAFFAGTECCSRYMEEVGTVYCTHRLP